MNEPDPIDDAIKEVVNVAYGTCLIETNWPEQAHSEPHPAPPSVRTLVRAGEQLPFIRVATQQEVQDYGLEQKLFSKQLTDYLTKDWGSW